MSEQKKEEIMNRIVSLMFEDKRFSKFLKIEGALQNYRALTEYLKVYPTDKEDKDWKEFLRWAAKKAKLELGYKE